MTVLGEKDYEEIPLSFKELYKQYLKGQSEMCANGILINSQFEFDMGNGFEEQNIIYAEAEKKVMFLRRF